LLPGKNRVTDKDGNRARERLGLINLAVVWPFELIGVCMSDGNGSFILLRLRALWWCRAAREWQLALVYQGGARGGRELVVVVEEEEEGGK
jgi:hypothetical protein